MILRTDISNSRTKPAGLISSIYNETLSAHTHINVIRETFLSIFWLLKTRFPLTIAINQTQWNFQIFIEQLGIFVIKEIGICTTCLQNSLQQIRQLMIECPRFYLTTYNRRRQRPQFVNPNVSRIYLGWVLWILLFVNISPKKSTN